MELGARVGLVSDWEGHRGPCGGNRSILYLNLGINVIQAVHLLFLHFTKCYMSMKRNMSAQHFGYPIDSAQCLPGVISFTHSPHGPLCIGHFRACSVYTI